MEAWVGERWHDWITRTAEQRRTRAEAVVSLDSVQSAIAYLFRAGGGEPTARVAPARRLPVGGPRGWTQRLAGSGTRASLPQCSPEVLALPPEMGVFEQREHNRDAYLWLAALASHWHSTGDWIGDNQRATAATLWAFPGLRGRYQTLLSHVLQNRPPADSSPAERRVQDALRASLSDPARDGEGTDVVGSAQRAVGATRPTDVRPVWLWLAADPVDHSATSSRPLQPDAPTSAKRDPQAPRRTDRHRRRAQRVAHERAAAPLLMFFRAESLLSWSEFVNVNRATDDDDDDQALNAANDMDVLTVTASQDTPTASRVKFDLDLPSAAVDDLPLGPGLRLPEWDWKHQRLLPEHCAVQCHVARRTEPTALPETLRPVVRRVRRRLEPLRAAPQRLHAQREGDDLDLDACIRDRIEGLCGRRAEAPAVYQRAALNDRSLATLLLADLSLSTDAHVPSAQVRVIDVIRDSLLVFGEALAAVGDPFAMWGFSSVRRQHVRLQHLKGFDETWSGWTRARVSAIKPGYYTRMGAAIRHATLQLQDRAERQRLLLILTDGKPNDLDRYEGRWGLEDTRHAVHEARAQGLTPFCISIDDDAPDYLPYLFGAQAWAQVHRPQDLAQRLTGLYAGLTR